MENQNTPNNVTPPPFNPDKTVILPPPAPVEAAMPESFPPMDEQQGNKGMKAAGIAGAGVAGVAVGAAAAYGIDSMVAGEPVTEEELDAIIDEARNGDGHHHRTPAYTGHPSGQQAAAGEAFGSTDNAGGGAGGQMPAASGDTPVDPPTQQDVQQVEVLGVDSIETSMGNGTVVNMTVDGTMVAVIDANGDGEANYLGVDNNHNNAIDNDELYDISNEHRQMAQIVDPAMQSGGYNDNDIALSNEGPDYVNEQAYNNMASNDMGTMGDVASYDSFDSGVDYGTDSDYLSADTFDGGVG